MNDTTIATTMTEIARILWAAGPTTEWNADTARAIAAVAQAAGYGPSTKRAAPAPKRGKAPKVQDLPEALARLNKALPKPAKPGDASAHVLVCPSGIYAFPASNTPGYRVHVDTGIDRGVYVDRVALAGALKGMTDWRFVLRGNSLVVLGGGLETSVPTSPDIGDKSETWESPAPDMSGAVEWSHAHVQDLVQVARVASTDRTRDTINNVLVEPDCAVATDGHRLEARYLTTQLTVPLTVRSEVLELIASTKQPCYVKADKAGAWLHSGLFTVRVVNKAGEFPAWRRVLPTEAAALSVRVHKDTMRDFCKRAAKEDARLPVTMEVKVNDSTVRLRTVAMRNEDCASCYDPKCSLSVGFNPRYMLDLLDLADDYNREVDLLLRDDFAPMEVRIGEAALHVMMPVRI